MITIMMMMMIGNAKGIWQWSNQCQTEMLYQNKIKWKTKNPLSKQLNDDDVDSFLAPNEKWTTFSNSYKIQMKISTSETKNK